MNSALLAQVEKIIRSNGADGVATVMASQVVTDAQFREICRRNACGRYGKCHKCPPDIGQIGDLFEEIKKYPYGVLYQSVASIEDCFDFEGMTEAGAAHSQMSSRIHQSAKQLLKQPFLHLSSGCWLCPRCAKLDAMPCRYPELALAAMEGYGIDVYQTAKQVGLPYNNGENTVTYFGVILFTE